MTINFRNPLNINQSSCNSLPLLLYERIHANLWNERRSTQFFKSHFCLHHYKWPIWLSCFYNLIWLEGHTCRCRSRGSKDLVPDYSRSTSVRIMFGPVLPMCRSAPFPTDYIKRYLIQFNFFIAIYNFKRKTIISFVTNQSRSKCFLKIVSVLFTSRKYIWINSS